MGVFCLQNTFDNIWRNYITYSAGETLFGLPTTEYPSLHKIRKELNLLQKLYGLYNDVIEKVNGYYDIPWVDVSIDSINQELQEFQNRFDHLSHFKDETMILFLWADVANTIFT